MGFQNCQYLERASTIGNIGIKFGSVSFTPPPCAAFRFGKQERTTKGKYITDNHDSGSLKVDKIDPRDIVFSDQYESCLEGLHFTARGHSLSTQKCRGGTILCDADSGKVAVLHQFGFAITETIQARLKFECEDAAAGILIKQYCTKNGVYTSKYFVNEIISKGQGIKHSDVGGHNHNVISKNRINTIVHNYQTMMIHLALLCPKHNERDIWYQALSHA